MRERSLIWLIVIGLVVLVLTVLVQSRGEKMLKNQIMDLPKPKLEGVTLEKAIAKRRSIRSFAKKELSLAQISQLLWAAYGSQDVEASTGASKTVPSAGALYPMEIYVLMPQGLYRYLAEEHKIKRVSDKDLRTALCRACLWQDFVVQAPFNLVITAVFPRITGRYGKRGIRYAWIEAGHVAQNVHLEAVSLGLGSVPVGAFDDEGVKKALGLAKEEEPLYIIPVGYPR